MILFLSARFFVHVMRYPKSWWRKLFIREIVVKNREGVRKCWKRKFYSVGSYIFFYNVSIFELNWNLLVIILKIRKIWIMCIGFEAHTAVVCIVYKLIIFCMWTLLFRGIKMRGWKFSYSWVVKIDNSHEASFQVVQCSSCLSLPSLSSLACSLYFVYVYSILMNILKIGIWLLCSFPCRVIAPKIVHHIPTKSEDS